MREIALDTETTGLDPATGHRVIEIGCVEMVNRIRTGKSFHTYLNPERDIPEEATRIHGITLEKLLDKPLFNEVAMPLLEFLGDAPLVIHNAQFDMKFLNAELSLAGFAPLEAVRAVDTVLISRKQFPGAPANLDALCRRFSIDLSARTKHGALLDAELLAEVYLELTGGRQAAMALDAARSQTAAETAAAPQRETAIPPRQFPPTPEELAAHAEFIKKLKDAAWEGA